MSMRAMRIFSRRPPQRTGRRAYCDDSRLGCSNSMARIPTRELESYRERINRFGFMSVMARVANSKSSKTSCATHSSETKH